MLFNNNVFGTNFLLIILIILWQVVLTYLSFKDSQFYRKLTKNSERNLESIFKKLVKDIEVGKDEIEQIKNRLRENEIRSKKYFQKYALVRFNPFDDSGGDQSFVFVILNEDNDGMIISSLHARDRSRIYAKPITDGQAVKYELSNEENQALKQAIEKS